MTKTKTQFRCSSCSATTQKWAGKCVSCGNYNTMEEYTAAAPGQASIMGYKAAGSRRSDHILTPQNLSDRATPPARRGTGHPELDRALGGGLVEGSVVLLGGDPGIGKSTLLLQVAAQLSAHSEVVYFSGEESADQIQLRAQRLGVHKSPVALISSSDALAIADYIETLSPGAVAIVDSIQAMNAGGSSAPGSISQVKESASHLIPAAKTAGVILILVNHVTQEGTLAGPNLLKHAVDVTAYLEQDRSGGLYRLLRTEKNRFGAAGEIGVFEMTETGMLDVENPSELFISQRDTTAFGTVIYPSLEGTRPLLLEVQALVSPTPFGTGRRSATGWDTNRLNMLLATMGARLGLQFADHDIYVNVAGGMKVTDPAMDLAVALALLSARAGTALPKTLAAFGEIGLAGEIRSSARSETRIKECMQLGLVDIICPGLPANFSQPRNGNITSIHRVAEIIHMVAGMETLYAA